ncbi:MAG: cobalamin biosynthesis bifunctional protein CbiET [Rhizobiales bacterium]|nr:cobalamin biosynthesis bifunctional protein CbiET [Hyphomicrobiales bacterium]
MADMKMPTDPWLTLLGVGDNGLDSLTPAARALFDAARTIIAPARVLEEIDTGNREVIPWTFGVSQTIELLLQRRGDPITILATGDPMHFGIGATMMRHIGADEIRVIPTPSAFSLAAARLGWAQQDVAMISLHGRSVHALSAYLQPGNRIIALTSTGRTIGAAANILVERGFGGSRIAILEHMGGRREKIVEMAARDIRAGSAVFADFNTLAVECVADPDAACLSPVPGLPDEAYEHDGQLTKREIRAATLAHLGPMPGALLWDIGAGNGSIAIEWMRTARGAKAIAIESDAAGCERIAANAMTLGTPTLDIRHGEAPLTFEGLDAPDAVFIGGGMSEEGILEAAWAALKPGGRLVANAVTVESEARIFGLRDHFGGELVRMQVSRAEPVGRFLGWKPMMPVTLWSVRKGFA